MRLACQIVWFVLLIIGFLVYLYVDICGRPAKPPTGFKGVVGTFAAYAFSLTLSYGCGFFDVWFKP